MTLSSLLFPVPRQFFVARRLSYGCYCFMAFFVLRLRSLIPSFLRALCLSAFFFVPVRSRGILNGVIFQPLLSSCLLFFLYFTFVKWVGSKHTTS